MCQKCGCNTCETDGTALMLNESKAPRSILSEGLKHHIDANKPLTDNFYTAGSRDYFDLIAEARSLYSRGILEFTNKRDIELLTETDQGHFGIFEGKKVPLDFPIAINEAELQYPDFDLDKNIKYQDTSISSGMWRYTGKEQGGKGVYRNLMNDQILGFDRSDFGVFRKNLSSHFDFILDELNEVTRYSGFNRNPEDPDSEPFNPEGAVAEFKEELRALFGKFKGDLKNPEFIKGVAQIMVNWKPLLRSQLDEAKKKYKKGDKLKVKLKNGKEFDITFDSYSSNKGMAYGKIDGNRKPFSLDAVVNEAKKKAKKKDNRPIGKPMRSSSGGKAYKVYVKDPKTKKIKTVRFGSGGLRAKINDSKARAAFAARHKCSTKKDRTKAGYWSCRLPRYAKLLGLKSSFSGFW